MGVQGLTTFIEGNKSLLQDVKFRDSRLLIDGSSLYYNLYFNHGLDQQHGGDYDAFYSLLTQFLSALAACNIKPYIVLDGGMDPSEKKFSTLCERLQSKIKRAHNISHGRHGSVLPLLTRQVFIQVLIQCGVPLVQCPFEADWDIACLARQWNCPILSRDSDFYIFDLPGGYFPFNLFQWTNVNGKAKQPYISARRYTTSALCRWFGGLNKELLPLFAVLIGNDYGTPKEAEHLLQLIDEHIAVRGSGRGTGRTPAASRIEGLLVWLSSFSGPAEALEEISQLVQKDAMYSGQARNKKKDGVSSKLLEGMQEYNISSQSSLALWFSGKKEMLESWTRLELPECLVKSAAQGLLAGFVVDALVMQRGMLVPQVENGKLASSHCSAKFIRQTMYGILLYRCQTSLPQEKSGGGKETSGMRQGSEGNKSIKGSQSGGGRKHLMPVKQKEATVRGEASSVYVEEYDRMDLNLKKTQVEARRLKQPLSLDAVGQTSEATRIAVLLEALGVTESALSPVPLHWRLAVAVTAFWQREAKPTPTQPQLHALLMGFVYGELNLQYTGSRQNWTPERDLCAAMVRLRVRPGERMGLDLQDAHSYSQWLACLWAALCLNQILLQPMPEPYLPWLFSGTLVHGLVKYLKGGRAPESLLRKSSLSEHLYSSLLDAVNKCMFKGHPESSASGRGRRRGHRGKRDRVPGAGSGQGNKAMEGMNNRFALLMSEEDDDDE